MTGAEWISGIVVIVIFCTVLWFAIMGGLDEPDDDSEWMDEQ